MRKETIGNCTLYLGDCKEIMPLLGNFDALVTDPPYGLGKKMQGGGAKKWQEQCKKMQEWDNHAPTELVEMAINKCEKSIVWGGNYFVLPPSRQWLVWNKGGGMKGRSYAEAELAWCSMDGVVRVFELSPHTAFCNGTNRVHPTQKPEKLMDWCLSFLPDSDTIFDPFMGSGTTGVACVKKDKTFIGIEKDKEYFEIACKRIYESQNQSVMKL